MKSADNPISHYQVPMMPVGLRFVSVRGAGSYFLYLSALGIMIVVGVVGAKLVARNFVAMVEQSANDNPRALSRVERHLQTVARIEVHQPVVREDQIIALVKPAMPPVVLAAAIDRAERADQPAAVHSNHHTRVEGWVKSADRETHKKRKSPVLAAASAKKSGKANKAAKSAVVQVAQTPPNAAAAVVIVADAQPAQASASQKYLSGKMALLPPSSSKLSTTKLQKPVKAGTQAATPPPLPAEILPQSPASPGEIIRVSLLGPP